MHHWHYPKPTGKDEPCDDDKDGKGKKPWDGDHGKGHKDDGHHWDNDGGKDHGKGHGKDNGGDHGKDGNDNGKDGHDHGKDNGDDGKDKPWGPSASARARMNSKPTDNLYALYGQAAADVCGLDSQISGAEITACPLESGSGWDCLNLASTL